MTRVGALGGVLPACPVPGTQVGELPGLQHVVPPPAPAVPELAAGDPERVQQAGQAAAAREPLPSRPGTEGLQESGRG
ncbi:MAG TPA: hypothetical protein VMJ30_04595, partial [Gemmatimonadales bacterium]|nr:hypothetical protein [Gemmatimonadales bacterium]